VSALRDLYDRYSVQGEPLQIGADLVGSLAPEVAPMAKNAPMALRNVRLSKIDRAAAIMGEARIGQVLLERNAKRLKETAAENMRLKRKRYVPTKREQRTGSLPFPTTPLVGSVKSTDGVNLSQATDYFTSVDAESVTVEGDDARLGLHILIHVFYQAAEIQHVIAFSGFQESPVDVIRGITHDAFSGDLATFQYRNPTIVFSTCRCHFPASVSLVPLEEGVNFVTEMTCPPNLKRIASGAPDHFDLFGPVGDVSLPRPPFKLLSYPLFDVRLGSSTIFKQAFFDIETVELSASLGKGWDMRAGVAGHLDIFGGSFKVWSDIAGDNDPLVFHLAFGQAYPVLTDLRALAPLFSNNGDYLSALPDSSLIESGLVPHIKGFDVHEATWVYDLYTHQITSLAVSVLVLHTLTLIHPRGAVLDLSEINITWLVGFPDSGTDRTVSVSAEAKLTHKLLGVVPVSIALGTKRLEITGSVPGMPHQTFQALIESLSLTQQDMTLDDFGDVTEVTFSFDFTEGIQVWQLNSESDSVEWSRRD